VPAADAIERVAIAVAPEVEELARFALRNVEMRPLGQTAGYGSHNLSSFKCP
jgi:hypothetical protein